MPMKSSIAAIAIAAALFLPARAEQQPTPAQMEAIKKVMNTIGELQYQSGEIPLLDGKVKIKLTDDFRFLDPVSARKVLVDIWGNPPGAGSVTGLIVPKDVNFLEASSWAAVIQWSDVGYVKDGDYDGIDFNKMLAQLKEESVEANRKRQAAGYGQMLLNSWATPPHYDKQTHKLYWAKAYDVNRPEQALNYDIRVLGRAGVIELSMIAGMAQLQEIEAKVPAILGMVDFTDGNRYADFKPGTDKVAAYGIAGLIAGGVLAKAGFFKLLWVGILAAKKFIIIGVIAIGIWIKKLLGARTQA